MSDRGRLARLRQVGRVGCLSSSSPYTIILNPTLTAGGSVAPGALQPDEPLTPEALLDLAQAAYPGLVLHETWGERGLFYNPGGRLAHGVYFLTIKNADGPNDRASQLDRADVFRVSFGLSRARYATLFGPPPPRPRRGEPAELPGIDPTALDVLMPHPVYAWMGWAVVLNPSAGHWRRLAPLLDESYGQAVSRFDRRCRGEARV